MKDGDLQWVGLVKMHHGGPKQCLNEVPIVGPSVVPEVDIGPMQFMASGA
jgi:hypothetical protein